MGRKRGVGLLRKQVFIVLTISLILVPVLIFPQSKKCDKTDSLIQIQATEYIQFRQYDSLQQVFLEAGVEAEMQGKYLQSFKYLHLSLKIATWRADASAMAKSYINIGIVWFDLSNSKKAIFNYKKALYLAQQQKDTLIELKSINNIGNVYLTLKNNADTALVYFSRAFVLSEKIGFSPGMHAIGGNIAQIYLLQQEFEKAEEILLQLMQSDSSISYYYFIAAMIERNRGNYTMAIKQCKKAMNMANEPEFLLAIETEMANIAFEMSDFENAYQYLCHKTALSDSIHSLNVEKHIVELEKKYENEKRLLDIARLENTILADQKKDQKILFILGLLLLLLLLVVSYLYFFRKNARNKMKLIQAETESKTAISFIEGEEAERKRLANELHDGLVGSITGLRLQLYTKQMKASDKEADTISSVIGELDALATETRNISHKLFPVVLEKFGLREALKKQFLPFTDRDESIHLTLQFFGENYRYDLLIEKLVFHIIQELFGNIVKHAQTKEASLTLTTEREIISCLITDKGIGFDVSEFGNGQGLYSVRERLERIGGEFDVQSEIGKGTVIIWTIPAKYINTGRI
jgi:hypothetical protein